MLLSPCRHTLVLGLVRSMHNPLFDAVHGPHNISPQADNAEGDRGDSDSSAEYETDESGESRNDVYNLYWRRHNCSHYSLMFLNLDNESSDSSTADIPPPQQSNDDDGNEGDICSLLFLDPSLHDCPQFDFVVPDITKPRNKPSKRSKKTSIDTLALNLLTRAYLSCKMTHRQMERIIDSFQIFYNAVRADVKLPARRLRVSRKWYRSLDNISRDLPIIQALCCPNPVCKSIIHALLDESDDPIQVSICPEPGCGTRLLTDAGHSREMIARIPLKAYLDVAFQVPLFEYYANAATNYTSSDIRSCMFHLPYFYARPSLPYLRRFSVFLDGDIFRDWKQKAAQSSDPLRKRIFFDIYADGFA